MNRDHVEIEDKFDVPEGAQLSGLAEIAGVVAVEECDEELLEATYFDTEDLRLASLGLTLRRRTGGQDEGWHLKVPMTHGRYEVHQPLGDLAAPIPARLLDVISWTHRRSEPGARCANQHPTSGDPAARRNATCWPWLPTTGSRRSRCPAPTDERAVLARVGARARAGWPDAAQGRLALGGRAKAPSRRDMPRSWRGSWATGSPAQLGHQDIRIRPKDPAGDIVAVGA